MALILPEHCKTYKILGIDPGLNNTGIALYELDIRSGAILSIEAFTLISQKLYDNTGLDEEQYSERIIKLYKLKQNISQIVLNTNPASIACESPFYNRFRPMAYGALLETMGTIHNAIIEQNPNIYFQPIEPLLVKKTIGAGIKSGKIDVKESVLRTPIIMSVLKNDINNLDEHSIDAIAIGYTHLKLLNVL